VTLAAPVNRIRLLLTPDAPAEPPRDTTPFATSGPPPDPVESAKARAEAFDAALADAVRVLHVLLHNPSIPTRLAAANTIVNLKKASLRHRRPVFEVSDDSFLPPLVLPGDSVGGAGAEESDEEEDHVDPPEAMTASPDQADAGEPGDVSPPGKQTVTGAGHSAVSGSPDSATRPDRRSPVFEEETSGRRRWHGQETVPQQEGRRWHGPETVPQQEGRRRWHGPETVPQQEGRRWHGPDTVPQQDVTVPQRKAVVCTAGIVGLTADEFRRRAAELGLERWERLCERVAGRFTWPQLLRLVAREQKKAKRKRSRRPAKSQPVKRSEYRDVPITSDWPPDPPAPPTEPTPTHEEKTWSPDELREVEESIGPRRIGWESRFDHCQSLTFFSPG
jgi:hypothetical protein